MQKLLISAYATSPERGSECAVGWEITKKLGESFATTVLVCEKTPSNKPYFKEIQNFIEKNGDIRNVQYIPVTMPSYSKIFIWLHDLGFWPAYYWAYNAWQKAAYKKALELHHIQTFDIAYQLNMIGFREPGYLWKMDIPFVWGPLNGFHSIPFAFLRCFSGKNFIFQVLKHVSNEIQILLASRAKRAAKKASKVWCVDIKALKKISQWTKNAELMQETGLKESLTDPENLRNYNNERSLNIVCSGMMTPGKAYFIVIDALVRLNHKNFTLSFLGDGPLKASLIKKAEPLKDKVKWYGWVKHSEAVEIVKKADLLIHPSLKEGTPHSILEAVSMGVPVICHDTCGMGAVINEKNGFKIPYINADYSTTYLVELLDSIFETPSLLEQKFITIKDCVSELTWDYKVKKIAETIKNIVNSNLKDQKFV